MLLQQMNIPTISLILDMNIYEEFSIGKYLIMALNVLFQAKVVLFQKENYKLWVFLKIDRFDATCCLPDVTLCYQNIGVNAVTILYF